MPTNCLRHVQRKSSNPLPCPRFRKIRRFERIRKSHVPSLICCPPSLIRCLLIKMGRFRKICIRHEHGRRQSQSHCYGLKRKRFRSRPKSWRFQIIPPLIERKSRSFERIRRNFLQKLLHRRIRPIILRRKQSQNRRSLKNGQRINGIRKSQFLKSLRVSQSLTWIRKS